MNRTIQFWQLVDLQMRPLANAFPVENLMNGIRAAKQAGSDMIASVGTEGVQIKIEVQEAVEGGAQAPFLVLYKYRQNNEGHLDDHGVMGPMPLDEGQVVCEPTYLKFFERNIVGFLYHNEGPRPRRLTDYLAQKFGCNLALQPIYRKDLDETLRRMTLKYIELAIPAAQAAGLVANGANAGEFAAPLAAVSQLFHDGTITLRLSVGRGGQAAARRSRQESILAKALEFVGLQDAPPYTKATVHASDAHENDIPIDLLEARFVHKAKIPAAPFVPGQAHIRDDTPIINQQWDIDRALLMNATQPLATDAPDPGLLGRFRENHV